MLMHHRDAEVLGQHRREVVDRETVEDDRPRVGGRGAGGDVHQRRLPGAVLSEKCVHLARLDVERDVRERGDSVVVLGDAGHRERRLSAGAALIGWDADGG